MRRIIAVLPLLAAQPVAAQVILQAPSIDIRTLATRADVDALASSMPRPATSTPITDVMGGAIGTATTQFALRDHRHPRITDTQVVTTVTGGTFSGSYPAGFFAAAPTVDLSWVNAGALSMTCELTSDPTTSGFVGRCRTLSVASILAAGAGIKVHVISLPTTAP